jgi:hypothetical protein
MSSLTSTAQHQGQLQSAILAFRKVQTQHLAMLCLQSLVLTQTPHLVLQAHLCWRGLALCKCVTHQHILASVLHCIKVVAC